MERAMRIELTTKAWEAFVLPLNYARKIDCYLIVSRLFEMSNKIVLLKANVFLLLYVFDCKFCDVGFLSCCIRVVAVLVILLCCICFFAVLAILIIRLCVFALLSM